MKKIHLSYLNTKNFITLLRKYFLAALRVYSLNGPPFSASFVVFIYLLQDQLRSTRLKIKNHIQDSNPPQLGRFRIKNHIQDSRFSY